MPGPRQRSSWSGSARPTPGRAAEAPPWSEIHLSSTYGRGQRSRPETSGDPERRRTCWLTSCASRPAVADGEERAMQVRDAMTREVVSVGPDTSAKYAAEVMAERGFAAPPVVDDAAQLVGIVAEADVLRDRLPADPRLHARRDAPAQDTPPSLLVRGVMTARVRTVRDTDDIADI